MNKMELVAAIAANSGFSKKDAEKALNSVVDVITAELKAGGKVQLVGFGTFETKQRAAREGRNPKTNAKIKIPASKLPAFRVGKALKDEVNK